MSKIINRLSAKEMYQLTEFVKAGYVMSGLYDTDFAAKASTDLGFEVSDSSVRTARETLDLPSNRDVERANKATPAGNDELRQQISALDHALASALDRIAKLETNQRILTNFAQKAGPVKELSGLQFHVGGKTDGS